MSLVSSGVAGPAVEPAEAAPAAALSPTRPFYWSLRRELWENRSIYLAPLGVGAFVVVALVVHGITMPSHLPGMLATDPGQPGATSVTYMFLAFLLLATAFVTGVFYSLETLNSERRDRSILFWKSLPVADLTAVLAKASVPLLVLPLLTFAVIVVMQLTMVVLSIPVLLVMDAPGVARLWNEVQLLRMWPALLYAVVAIALWHAPVYAFLILVSGWARRTAVLWAILPFLALGMLEKLTMDTTNVAAFVVHRVIGWYHLAFAGPQRAGLPVDPLGSMTPGRLLGSPGLWIGLVVAAALLAAAARLRRLRDPV